MPETAPPANPDLREGSCKPGCIHLEPHTLDECQTHDEFMAGDPATCLDSISGCAVEGFHDHPENLPPDVVAMSEEGFGDA